MNILLVHNSYQQRGGEDQVFESEAGLLRANGHQVTRYHVSNDQISSGSVGLAARAIWNREHHRNVCSLILRTAPHVVHVHNTFPLVSPAVYYAARSCGIPVVQTLHNYRLLCPGGTLFRSGRICESCVGGSVPWRGVIHRCYRHSVAASATVSTMLAVHKLAGTWTSAVDQYIVLNEFARQQFIRAGFPAERLCVKPNFVDPDPGFASASGHGAIFVGRFTEEKGIHTLLTAWRSIGSSVPLDIIGDGPLAPQVNEAADHIPGIRWLGWLPRPDVFNALRGASVAIVPSLWYEPFGMNVAEAFAVGVPVLASAIGGLEQMIHQGRTGFLFQPGNDRDLATKVRWLCEHPDELAAMRPHARREFELNYTASANYELILHIYNTAISRRTAEQLQKRSKKVGQGISGAGG
jgi:glycosyltransferase involved in cell wall biosynthesis